MRDVGCRSGGVGRIATLCSPRIGRADTYGRGSHVEAAGRSLTEMMAMGVGMSGGTDISEAVCRPDLLQSEIAHGVVAIDRPPAQDVLEVGNHNNHNKPSVETIIVDSITSRNHHSRLSYQSISHIV